MQNLIFVSILFNYVCLSFEKIINEDVICSTLNGPFCPSINGIFPSTKQQKDEMLKDNLFRKEKKMNEFRNAFTELINDLAMTNVNAVDFENVKLKTSNLLNNLENKLSIDISKLNDDELYEIYEMLEKKKNDLILDSETQILRTSNIEININERSNNDELNSILSLSSFELIAELSNNFNSYENVSKIQSKLQILEENIVENLKKYKNIDEKIEKAEILIHQLQRNTKIPSIENKYYGKLNHYINKIKLETLSSDDKKEYQYNDKYEKNEEEVEEEKEEEEEEDYGYFLNIENFEDRHYDNYYNYYHEDDAENN